MTSDLAPIPEALLAPLLEDAGAVLRTLEPRDVPTAARSLVGFDARALMRGAARRQLHRALETDDAFRAQVVERFLARPEVADVLGRWSAREALVLVEDARRDGVLPLLASTLYAARPEGWTFASGVAYAAAARDAEDAHLHGEARARAAELAGATEARRRADAARAQADQERDRAERDLRSERQTRRESIAHVEQERDDARREAAAATEAAAAAEAAKASAEARAERAEARATRVDADLRELQRPPPAVDTEGLLAAAHELRGIADRLETLAPVPLGDPVEPGRVPAAPRPRPRRARAVCPPGLSAETRAGLDGMLRTPGVLLVVDGYNVSKTAWDDTPLEEQRQRLVAALAELHLRIRCDVIVAFDGAGLRGVPLPRKPGVRVVFSEPGETADDVVVREAAAPPTTIPVVVASSDAEVRARAEAVGAVVVPSSVLLSVLRR